MATTLSEQINNLNKRVGALEDSGLDGKETVTRIVKVYGNIKVTVTITVKAHDYLPVGTHVMAGQFTI